MSGTLSAAKYVASMQQLRQQFSETSEQLEQLATKNQQHLDDLGARLSVAQAELVAAVLPELTPSALARAVQLTGYLPLTTSDPLAAMERNRQALLRRVAEIEQDRRYRDRLLLRAPRIGLLSRDIVELEEFRAPLADFLNKIAHERLERLIQGGYGTPGYQTGFWRMSYYVDWRAADEICARAGKKTFAEVRTEYLSAQQTIAVYDDKLGKLRQEVRLGETLECEHDDCLRQLESLPQTHLGRLREQLGSYLRDLDLVAIGDRLALEPQIDGLAKRYLGIRKQTEYLRETGQHVQQHTSKPVQEIITSLDREIRKYQRPSLAHSTVPRERVARLKNLQQRNVKCVQTTQRYQQTQTVVYSFHDYHHGRIDDDFLWWDLMSFAFSRRSGSSQRVQTQFIPEVTEFREAHPDYHYQPPPRSAFGAAEEAVAAAASIEPELELDPELVSETDPS